MADKLKARSLIKDYFQSIGRAVLSDSDDVLEKLASTPDETFQKLAFPVDVLLNRCFYMGCGGQEYEETTDAGLPLELFSDFCHSFVFCFSGCSKAEIERGHNTFRNYSLVRKREILPRDIFRRLPPDVGIEDDFYVVWTIYQRNEDVPPVFGPKYFSVLAMNGDVLGNFGVLFKYGGYRPFGLAMPVFGLDWSLETFHQCNHHPPTREVVRRQFVPRVEQLVNMLFRGGAKPEYLLSLRPWKSFGSDSDDFGLAELYDALMSKFPKKVLEVPACLCRNDAEGSLALFA